MNRLSGGIAVLVMMSVGLLPGGFRASTSTASGMLSAPGLVSPKDSLFGVFEGRTPCGPIATGFTGFPAQNCEKIKWRLTLYRDAAARRPTTWIYDGTRTTRRGRWEIATVPGADGSRAIYHLNAEGAGRVLSFLSIDENVLLLLDRELKVVVGDASWSYALNRVRSTRDD